MIWKVDAMVKESSKMPPISHWKRAQIFPAFTAGQRRTVTLMKSLQTSRTQFPQMLWKRDRIYLLKCLLYGLLYVGVEITGHWCICCRQIICPWWRDSWIYLKSPLSDHIKQICDDLLLKMFHNHRKAPTLKIIFFPQIVTCASTLYQTKCFPTKYDTSQKPFHATQNL